MVKLAKDEQQAFTGNGLVCGHAQRRLSNVRKYGSQHLQILSTNQNNKETTSVGGR